MDRPTPRPPSSPAPAPRVRALEPLAGERVRIVLDDGTDIEAPAEALAQEGLARGDPLDEALGARLREASLAARARSDALRLLAVRARSRSELRRRLLRKELPAKVVESCLDDLERQGLLDDAAFARALVRQRVRRSPRGPVRLRQELHGRGVDRDVADRAIAQVIDAEELSVRALAVEAGLAWLRRQSEAVVRAVAGDTRSDERERARRRLAGHLARRGFAGEALVGALDAVRARARATDDAG